MYVLLTYLLANKCGKQETVIHRPMEQYDDDNGLKTGHIDNSLPTTLGLHQRVCACYRVF